MAVKRPEARRVLAVLALAAAALVTVGCCDKAGPGPSEAIFPATFRQAGFRMVRPCRAPGEHSALNGFTVWVDQASADVYDELLRGSTARGREMPDGSIVVKELYVDRGCSPAAVDHWVAMKKVRGFDPDHGDWSWQDLSAKRVSTVQGRVPACYVCHEGGDAGSCRGFGAARGMDYLCTAP